MIKILIAFKVSTQIKIEIIYSIEHMNALKLSENVKVDR